MPLPDVALNDPHVAAHNDEREAINKLQDLTDPTFQANLSASIEGTAQPLVDDAIEAEVERADGAYVPNSTIGAEFVRTADANGRRAAQIGLANRGVDAFRILVCGTSIHEGEGTTNLAYRWQERMAATLRALYPTTGVTNYSPNNYYPVGYAIATGSTVGNPWVKTGSPTAQNAYGVGARAQLFDASGEGAILTISAKRIRLHWIRTASAASFRYKVVRSSDSSEIVGWTTVSTNTGTALLIGRTLIDSLDGTQHVVTVEWVSGSVYFAGAEVYRDEISTGIQIFDSGRSGSQAGTPGWSNLSRLTDVVNLLQPHLILVDYGINEQGNNVAPATFKTNLLAWIAAAKAGVTTPLSIGLVKGYGRRTAGTYPWSDYRAVYDEIVAADSSCFVIDMGTRMPPPADTTYDTWADTLPHANDRGHGLYAEGIRSVVTA
jgi:hypothetical protein